MSRLEAALHAELATGPLRPVRAPRWSRYLAFGPPVATLTLFSYYFTRRHRQYVPVLASSSQTIYGAIQENDLFNR